MRRLPALESLCVFALAYCPPLLAHDCDILLSAANLEADLDHVLGPWTALVRERHVSIDPDNRACYVQIQIVVNAPLGGDCALDACSVATFKDQKIGLRAFNVGGCDALLSIIPISRHVPTALADASEEINAGCGHGAFEISSVEPFTANGEAKIRVHLRSSLLQTPRDKG